MELKIELPAKKTVKLASGGMHVMLIGIKQPLREKDSVPLELTIEEAGGAKSTVRIEAEVRPIAAAGSHAH